MKVMLIDDSKTMRNIQRSVLKQIGIEQVEEACDGQDALSKVGAFAPDLILVDWNMPNMTGIELLDDGLDAFAIRKVLLENAERSIDLQYYIWHDDLTGNLMLEQVRAAAGRGVRVRLLLDDRRTIGVIDGDGERSLRRACVIARRLR